MANETNVEVKGLDSILAKIEEIASGEAIKQKLGQACALVERAAKEKAPKDNGELRRSITSKVEGLTGIIFTPLEYAPYVEYGTGLFAEVAGRKDTPWSYQDDEGEWHSTSGQKPQPFMRPALNDNRTEILKILGGK
jgi:HK97 gp10 family phage protein